MIKHIIILFPLILSLYSSRINYESKEAEFPHSASSLFDIQKDSSLEKQYNIALSLYKKDKYYDSLEIALFILDKESNDTELILKTNKLISEIYQSINDHKKAIVYSKKVLNQIEKRKLFSDLKKENKDGIKTETLLKIANSFLLIPNVDSAKFYFEKTLEIKNFSRKTRIHQGKVYSNLSGIHFYYDEYRDFNKAEEYAYKAIEIHKGLNDNQSLAADYGNLASIYMEKDNPKKAKELYFKALDFIKDDTRLKAVKYKEVLYDNLGWAMYNLEDYIAYDYLDKSISIRDSLRDASKADVIKELEIMHNNDIKLRAIETQKQLAQQNTLLVGGIGVGAVLLLLYFLNVFKLRQQKLQNELSKKELVQQRSIEKIKSESQIKILNATLDGKEAERKQIAETLHDNVSAMLSSANLHLQASQKQFNGNVPAEIQKTQKIILEASQQIRDLSHNLVSSILLKFGLEYALKDAAENFSNSQINFFTKIEGLNRYDQDFEIKVYNIIQEFSNNIIKHSQANEAFIKVEEEDGELNVLVEDNGVGFNVEDPINKGGIGLNQINARVTMLQGTFIVESRENEGTKIKITLPIKERKKAFIG